MLSLQLHKITTLITLLVLNDITRAAPCNSVISTAGGGPPNTVLPLSISQRGLEEIQLAQFLENLEVSFFSAGSSNLTAWNTHEDLKNSVEVVKKIAAQEQVHLESLSTILEAYGAPSLSPCVYSFPVNSPKEFFQLAHLIGSAGIGSTISLSERLASTDPMLSKLVSSILTVEARHDAFFRQMQNEVPNPTPFETGSTDIWAYNIALSFIAPGSCPVQVPVPILPRLSYETLPITNSTRLRKFSWDPQEPAFTAEKGKTLHIGWVNQVDKPIYTPLNLSSQNSGTAVIPQEVNGIAFAVLTTQKYDGVEDLARGAITGPVVIPVS